MIHMYFIYSVDTDSTGGSDHDVHSEDASTSTSTDGTTVDSMYINSGHCMQKS